MTNDFGYNVRSEVISAMMSSNQFGYAYDPIGNRQTATNNAESLSYVANELNQYTSISNGVTLEPSYDDDGNLVAYGDWTFTWNGENRLVAAQQGKQCQVTFAYDYAGRRVSKVTEDGSGTTECDYVYDGWALIRERIASGETAQTNSYVYGLDLSGGLQGAGTIGGILATVREGDSAPVVGFYAYDANGNVTDLVGTNGTGLAHYEYDPFGNSLVATGALANDNPFRFSTKYTDDETGLVYYGYRYYDPLTGRWLNRDPIGEMAGANLHHFVRNCAIDSWEYLGLKATYNRPGPIDLKITPPEPRDIMPKIVDVIFNLASMARGERAVGQAESKNIIVDCICACLSPSSGKGRNKYYISSCAISWDAEIQMVRDAKAGVFGHEQKHVVSRNMLVAEKAPNYADFQNPDYTKEFTYLNSCEEAATKLEAAIDISLSTGELSNANNNHSDEDPKTYVNSESPTRLGKYPPPGWIKVHGNHRKIAKLKEHN